jgi:drug/metabolite transporter (DMT)-like permease
MKRYLPTIGILICSLIWGSTWLAIKFGLDTLPPFLFAAIRFAIAFGCLFVWMKVQRLKFPSDGHTWKVMTVLGAVLGLDYALVFWGEQFIDSGIAAVLFSTMPFFVIAFGRIMIPGHAVTRFQTVGITLSFAGVVVVFLRNLADAEHFIWGDLAMIGASSCGAFISVYAKKHAGHIHPVTVTTAQIAVCTMVLTAAGLAAEDPTALRWTWEGWMAILYLALFGSAMAFVLYMWVIKKVSPVEASIVPVVSPLVAVLLGWLMRAEPISWNVLAGGTMIVAGVFFVNILPQWQLPAQLDTQREAA